MAKVTKSAVAPASVEASTETATSAAPVKKVMIKEPDGADRFFRVLGDDGKGTPLTHINAKGEKVPLNTPQVKVIANLLEAAGDTGMTRKELCDQLPAAGLVTRQPIGRIVSYYQKDLVANGIARIEKSAVSASTK